MSKGQHGSLMLREMRPRVARKEEVEHEIDPKTIVFLLASEPVVPE